MSNGVAPPDAPQVKGDPVREYVTGGTPIWTSRTLRTLPHAIDDVTLDFGDDLYDRMLQDPMCAASVNVLKAGILEDGAHLTSPVTDDQEDGYGLGQEIVAFCTTALDEIDIPIDDVLWNLLDALPFGNKVAELVYRQDGQYLVLRAIKVKPRHATSFVVDQFMNVLGLQGPIGLRQTADGAANAQPPLLPLEKFAVLSFRPKDSDPRGRGILRPAYNPWWLKMQTWVEFLKYLSQFASGSLVGKTPPNAKAATGDTQTPQQKMLTELLAFHNGTAIALPNGAELDILFSAGEGQAFHRAFELYGREIVTAILNQTRVVLEAEHGSKADSETSQDILGTLIRQAKKGVVRMIRRDILRPLVRYNFGEAAVALTPLATLGNVEQQDWSAMASGIAALTSSNFLHPSQFPKIDLLLNLPPRLAPESEPMDATTNDPETQQEGTTTPVEDQSKSADTGGAP